MEEAVTGKQIAYAPLYDPPVMQQPTAITSTTIVINQQPQTIIRGWHSGICGCCEDMKSCCCAFFLGHCYYACLASRMGEDCCVGFGCVPGGHVAMRVALRHKHGIPGTICDDACMVSCCLPCSMCQLAREMDQLGYQPKDGCC